MKFTEEYDFREALVALLEQDLVGPSAEDEEIADAPITRYAAGILFPQNAGYVAPEEDVDQSDDGDDEGEVTVADPPVALANVRNPSSMGITFSIDPNTGTALSVRVTAGRYEKLSGGEDDDTGAARVRHRQTTTVSRSERWTRQHFDTTMVVAVDRPERGSRREVFPGLELFTRVRPADGNGAVSVTLILVNTLPGQSNARDATSWFQPRLHVSGRPGGSPFTERETAGPPADDEDLDAYRLLYRHTRTYGTGHGCSIQWDLDNTPPAWLSSTFTPQHELLLSDSNPDITGPALSWARLARGDASTTAEDLSSFCDGYGDWIRDRRAEVTGLNANIRSTAEAHMASCDEALARMRAGVEILRSDPVARTAFQLANEAMLDQRARGEWLRAGAPDGGPGHSDDSLGWRPFQLAFVLLCLRGIVVPSASDRDMADLLWFPTGGGKTEAYLGLIAFTVFLRRLRRGRTGLGVTVLMRYTLRLLTLQQFERAALLMCSCEAIRRRRTDLGDDPISLGLWVGQGGTPNTLDQARKALDRLGKGVEVGEGNPVQLHSCPWCGEPLDGRRNYYIAKSDPRLVILCHNKACEFESGLPVFLVDEDLFRHHPTLIIATVDKFASLPWNERTRALFNLDLPEVLPPELIIQDELHLISGPLGTLTGLYETAVDMLCTQTGIRPKVIASTATIRRAARQARGLFDREVRQFPPPGLDSRDSYFAVEAPRSEKGTRLYLGLMAPATSQTTLLVRTYAALLQGGQDLPASPNTKDPYWTLVGYFNSLRVLAGARMQVQDDVESRVTLLSRAAGTEARPIENTIELTSREASGEIPGHLRRMDIRYPDRDTLDVILATNMISVGVDIDRLGLMVVMGQPQGTSEYIQATSRVGRQRPGLVVVLLNAARSRDRSHYESFTAYHSALYRQVESTSVTPFSARSRDRGLHAVLVALARHLVPTLRDNQSAQAIASQFAAIAPIRAAILERVATVEPEEAAATAAQLDGFLADWLNLAHDSGVLEYRNDAHPDRALLIAAGSDAVAGDDSRSTLWSLRDVDQSSNLYLVK